MKKYQILVRTSKNCKTYLQSAMNSTVALVAVVSQLSWDDPPKGCTIAEISITEIMESTLKQ